MAHEALVKLFVTFLLTFKRVTMGFVMSQPNMIYISMVRKNKGGTIFTNISRQDTLN